jgi:gamma-glutamyltranspeptidase/glutathione hydrolase
MVATSQPLATYTGVRLLADGGNAVDAALGAAAVLCVTEPMSTGIGGDCFALVWRDGQVLGLDAAGPAPVGADPLEPVAERGPRSITVPGAVAGWDELARRFGRLGLDRCMAPAVELAQRGFALGTMASAAWRAGAETSTSWAVAAVPGGFPEAPAAGSQVRLPELAKTLRTIADEGRDGFYEGPVARAVCAASWLDEEDLAGYRAAWVQPLRVAYRSYEVAELPPPTQGVAALEALALLQAGERTLADQVRCAQLALEDAQAEVRDGADVSSLLDPAYVSRRRERDAHTVGEPGGGTVYLCAVDGDGLAVSFIQSLYGSFGSGVVAPGTGVVLQNRGACFAISGRVEPGRRPYHTIIPGMLLRAGALAGPFGVMGGFIQAQAHMQLVSSLVDDGLDPQAALDRARFRVQGDVVYLEEGLWERAAELRRVGHRVLCDRDTLSFGGGQAILASANGLVGGSDPRKDGYAAGF